VERKLRGIDILGLIFATLCMLEAIAGLFAQPVYRKMFADFGTTLPAFTTLMLRPATLVVAGLAPMLLVAEGAVRARSETAQLIRCVIAIVTMVGLLAGFGIAMYLPIFTLAGSIQ
jgi:hypothetical protein